KWSFLPGGQWIQKVFFPQMQKRGIFGDKDRNLILGLSTGGRGVALLSLQNPGTFKAGASLSGDYDQIRMTHDNLMKALYGDYERFSRRWQSLDNPETEAQKNRWKMPIYIGHGKKDKVVPFEQSRLFYETLKQKNPGIQVIFSQPENAGHDFPFWNSQLKGVFDFFERFLTL
ncbi:MAG: prolyl oligopeptidase family serine peptidase, partial [Spirochaetia bacterium]|nr:prolyl oligopeptidase family serine peptidase [Spirochaetia bacterium]